MGLSEEQKKILDVEIEKIRDIGEYIMKTTNVRKELIPDMANAIYLKMKEL